MTTTKASNWDLILILSIVTIIFLVFPLGCHCSDQIADQKKMPSDTGNTEEKARYIHVSRVGGMVGGFSATSDSKYFGPRGLVQISKEETSGVLHMLKQGQLDTSAFFNELFIKADDFAPQKSLAEEVEDNIEVSEYYPPQITICLSIPKANVAYCNSYKEVEDNGIVTDLMKKIDETASTSELSPAESGLYLRAQRIHDPELYFIKADIKVPDLLSINNRRLRKAIENEMALIKMAEITDTVMKAGSIELRPDRPVYIQIGKEVYLLTSYTYDG